MLDDGWVIKGAVALLAREIGVRASLDIDVYRAKAADAAEADLRQAAARDIGDWFRFEIGPRQTVGNGSKAVRFAVVAYIGQQQWERFLIDLVGSEPLGCEQLAEGSGVVAVLDRDLPAVSQAHEAFVQGDLPPQAPGRAL
jgi:hypothetical protein